MKRYLLIVFIVSFLLVGEVFIIIEKNKALEVTKENYKIASSQIIELEENIMALNKKIDTYEKYKKDSNAIYSLIMKFIISFKNNDFASIEEMWDGNCEIVKKNKQVYITPELFMNP